MTDGLLERCDGWGDFMDKLSPVEITSKFYANGYTPSQIDSMLGLKEGTAKKTIVKSWSGVEQRPFKQVRYE